MDDSPLALHGTMELLQEVMDRMDVAIFLGHKLMDKERGQECIRLKGNRVFLVGLVEDASFKLKTSMDEVAPGDDTFSAEED